MSEEVREMPPKSGPGRPANEVDEAENPLGNFLQNKLLSIGMTQEDFAQKLGVSREMVRRLIYVGPLDIHNSLVEGIYQALGLDDEEQKQFQLLLFTSTSVDFLPVEAFQGSVDAYPSDLQTASHSLDKASLLHAKPYEISREKSSSDGRGRSAKAPKTDIGKFLDTHLKAKGMKRSELAQAVEVSPSTITRFMQGNTSAIRKDTKEHICQELGLDNAARCEFDRLTFHEPTAMLVLHKFTHIDLEELINRLNTLQGHYDKGYVEFVWLEAYRFYNLLRKAGFSKQESRAIELQWRFGMLGGSAKEAFLTWEERVVPTIKFYDYIENEVRAKLPERQAELYIAQIQARRAPLYRELGGLIPERSDYYYEQSRKQFSKALDVYIHHKDTSEEKRLLVELYYSRAHVYAVQGMKHFWERDIELAQMRAHEEKDDAHRRELVSLVTYTQGEGFKRLAFNSDTVFSLEEKEEFARKGLECFKMSHMNESKWVGHGILNKVALTQCLAFVAPDEALKEAERLRVDAQQRYPSIVQKIDRTINYARQHLQ